MELKVTYFRLVTLMSLIKIIERNNFTELPLYVYILIICQVVNSFKFLYTLKDEIFVFWINSNQLFRILAPSLSNLSAFFS